MGEARDIYGTVFRNGTLTALARVLGANAAPIVPADIAALSYSLFLLGDDPDERHPIAGHHAVELSPTQVLFDALRTDPLWTVDPLGYNFRHTPDVTTHDAFAIGGRNYLLEYRLAPVSGQPIIVRFRIYTI